MEVGLVILCGCCEKQFASSMFIQNKFVEIEYNNEKLHNNTWDVYPNGKCVRIFQNHSDDGITPGTNGPSFLSVKVKPRLAEAVRNSHITTH